MDGEVWVRRWDISSSLVENRRPQNSRPCIQEHMWAPPVGGDGVGGASTGGMNGGYPGIWGGSPA